ncbi:hypothetical protein ACLB0R_05510 [Sphingomonas sp. GlSt437]|uniref:hypothetical protein n=1 Tax=Sphingomonas sp. GlSt437 TaxID=3389970 RepID=UPI003A863676
MRCYFVFIHGKLRWNVAAPNDPDCYQPSGFYCHRYVLASDEYGATRKAFERVRENLDRRGRWLSSGNAALDLEADEVSVAPLHTA